MRNLNFPSYKFRIKNSENNTHIFDVIRKKFVVLQPEEWVRQHCIQFLINEKNFPVSLINVEKVVQINGLNKRYDIVVYNSDGSIYLIVECKAPRVKISQSAFDQIARYNLALKASCLMVTNGLNHYFCTMDHNLGIYNFFKELPSYVKKKI
ncbi:MAG: type I restriction enzyme HsdR N-terminal domain-containing protein [Formosa sp.]|nr:type I restriction enzyme HsdR N-terminal domain-containing protein [Formosa sp.]MDC0463339.1 type I restriction enzyme HsdR N-terminal domain-containing protein [Flavobacteriaceae bacterium]